MDKLRSQLETIGDRRRAARLELATISAELPALVKRAHRAGIQKVEIARLAGISRPALDEMLKH